LDLHNRFLEDLVGQSVVDRLRLYTLAGQQHSRFVVGKEDCHSTQIGSLIEHQDTDPVAGVNAEDIDLLEAVPHTHGSFGYNLGAHDQLRI
jgi:hypothetical protein